MLLLGIAAALIVAGAIPIVLDLRNMRAPLARGATPVTEIVWAILPLAFAALLVVLAFRAA